MSQFTAETVPSSITSFKSKNGNSCEKIPVVGLPAQIVHDGKVFKLNYYNGELSYDRWSGNGKVKSVKSVTKKESLG